jgi:hypothetical protein
MICALPDMKEKQFDSAHFHKRKTGVQLFGSSEGCTPVFYVASTGTILSIMAVASDLKSKSG